MAKDNNNQLPMNYMEEGHHTDGIIGIKVGVHVR